jgi:hypothetical protein
MSSVPTSTLPHSASNPTTEPSPRWTIPRYEWLACAAVIVALVALRIHFVTHAGGMWRDEAHSVDVARIAQFPTWQDSFPILWINFLRLWIQLWGSSSDTCVRIAGLLCGLLMLVAAIWAPQGRARAIPWTTLILFGLSPVAISYGTEVRGYSLGVATQLWMIGAMQRFLLRPSGRGGLNLVVASLFAVQGAFSNSFLLLAGSMAAGIICIQEKRWKTLLALGANGLLAAATVSPYFIILLPQLTSDWVMLVRQEFSVRWYLKSMALAFGAGGAASLSAWALLCGGAAYAVKSTPSQPPLVSESEGTVRSGKPGAFEMMFLVFGTILVLAYLKWLKLSTNDWYYLPLMGLWAFSIDSVIATWPPSQSLSQRKLVIAILLAAVQVPAIWGAANLRLTNADLAAKSITALATKQDLVVVFPWYYGISLQRYYHGPAPWICLPKVTKTEVPGVIIHADGYRALKVAMMRENSLSAELAQVRETLQRGGRVFVLGDFPVPQPGAIVTQLPIAPNSPHGWSEPAYNKMWMQQLGAELLAHGDEMHSLPIETEQPIHNLESFRIYVVSGKPAQE